MKIDPFETDQNVLIIAEIGNNHEGRFEVAKQMVIEAAKCGVDAVKFQTFKTDLFISSQDTKRVEQLKRFELTYEQFVDLKNLAHSLGLLFISTPLDLDSASFLESVVDAFKIASSDNTFYPLIKKVCATDKPVIISTGLADESLILDLKKFIETEFSQKPKQLAILHCLTSYPAPLEEINLNAISKLQDITPWEVGYSDHSMGIDACVLAVAKGARILEKHFTLDHRYSDFRDHQLSADPKEMRDLVMRVRNAEKMLGKGEVILSDCEKSMVSAVRRSLALSRNYEEGEIIQENDLIWIRPGSGFVYGQESLVIGQSAKRKITKGSVLLKEDFS